MCAIVNDNTICLSDKEYNNHETHLFNTQLSSDQVADYYDRWAENGRYDEVRLSVICKVY